MGRKRQNIVGKKYNKLTVLNEDSNTLNIVKVECECGTIKTVLKGQLVKNNIFSCGRGICRKDFKSLIGSQFGKLTVLDEYFKTNDSHLILKLKCECGKEVEKRKQSVVSGHAGCGNRLCRTNIANLSNQKMHFLTPVNVIIANNGKLKWKCLCDCGNISYVSPQELARGTTKSCGCKKSSLISKGNSLQPLEGAINRMFERYRSGAKVRNILFNLSMEKLAELIQDNCHYCGSAPLAKFNIKNLTFQKEKIYFNGIDRKDNLLGYEIKNVVPCCWTCNFAKSNSSYKEFNLWIDKITDFRIKNR